MGAAGHARNCYMGHRAGLGLQVVLHTKSTRIPLSLLVCFAEGQAS